MKNCFSMKTNIVLLIIFGICIFLWTRQIESQEGFGPRWLRTKKNKMMRHVRRGFKPYYDDYFKKLERFRRKWL